MLHNHQWIMPVQDLDDLVKKKMAFTLNLMGRNVNFRVAFVGKIPGMVTAIMCRDFPNRCSIPQSEFRNLDDPG